MTHRAAHPDMIQTRNRLHRRTGEAKPRRILNSPERGAQFPLIARAWGGQTRDCLRLCRPNASSHADVEAFLKMVDQTDAHYAPLTISVTDFDENQLPRENTAIRQAVDQSLAKFPKCFSVRKTGLTIFPHDFWEFKKRLAHEKFAPWFCNRAFPALHHMDHHNRRGT